MTTNSCTLIRRWSTATLSSFKVAYFLLFSLFVFGDLIYAKKKWKDGYLFVDSADKWMKKIDLNNLNSSSIKLSPNEKDIRDMNLDQVVLFQNKYLFHYDKKE